MISLHNYRILRGVTAQEDVVASGSKAVFKNFELVLPEQPETEKAETAKVQEAEVKAPSEDDVKAKIMQDAMWKAEALIETAKAEAEQIRKDAYDKGFESGKQDGFEAGRQQALEEEKKSVEENIKDLKDKIEHYVTDMENQKEKILEKYLDDLKNISLAIGEKIVQASLKSSSEVVKKMILAATEKLKKVAWAKIYIAKTGDEMELQGDAQLLQELSKLSDNVKIVIMEDAEPGTCIIELPKEIIDISTGTQMENIRDILNNARV